MNKILKLKHWQIFFIWIISSFQVFYFIKTDFWFLSFFVYSGSFLVWIYTIGIGLNKSSKSKKRLNIWWVLYLQSLIPYSIYLRNFTIQSNEQIATWLLLPSATIGVIAIINIIIQTAKTIKFSETGKKQKTTDLFWEMFLLFSFIFGVWVLQPRINKLVINK